MKYTGAVLALLLLAGCAAGPVDDTSEGATEAEVADVMQDPAAWTGRTFVIRGSLVRSEKNGQEWVVDDPDSTLKLTGRIPERDDCLYDLTGILEPADNGYVFDVISADMVKDLSSDGQD